MTRPADPKFAANLGRAAEAMARFRAGTVPHFIAGK
jgi:hypothetical protein